MIGSVARDRQFSLFYWEFWLPRVSRRDIMTFRPEISFTRELKILTVDKWLQSDPLQTSADVLQPLLEHLSHWGFQGDKRGQSYALFLLSTFYWMLTPNVVDFPHMPSNSPSDIKWAINSVLSWPVYLEIMSDHTGWGLTCHKTAPPMCRCQPQIKGCHLHSWSAGYKLWVSRSPTQVN